MAWVVLWAVLKIPVMSPGDTPPRCDETGRVTELASSLGKALLLCDVTTVYKDGGEPEVYRTSSRLSTPNTV